MSPELQSTHLVIYDLMCTCAIKSLSNSILNETLKKKTVCNKAPLIQTV